MTDLDVVIAMLVILGALTALSAALDLVQARRVRR